MKKLILASSSPRRKELLSYLNIPFEIKGSNVKEKVDESKEPKEIVQELALQKATAVYNSLNEENTIVLGADTIVTLDHNILGKPRNPADAEEMLQMLSGREHIVYTGVAIVSNQDVCTFYEATTVAFWDLTDEEIHNYIKTGDPLDKAGAYGIQTYGSLLVKEIHGDYFNVVGLPIARTYRELKKMLSK